MLYCLNGSPSPLLENSEVQWPGVSRGRSFSPYHGLLWWRDPQVVLMSSITLKETALAGFTSAHWVLSKPKDSEMTPWGSAMRVEEITDSSSESPFPPMKTRSFDVGPSSFSLRHSTLQDSSSLDPPSDFWLAAQAVYQLAQMCLNPDEYTAEARARVPSTTFLSTLSTNEKVNLQIRNC